MSLLQSWAKVKGQVAEKAYETYRRRLEAEMNSWAIPHHVGIIMDGNRRFARNLNANSVAVGHRLGADKLDEVLSWCEEVGIRVVTVWGFSVDNFERSDDEVADLMRLFEDRFTKLVSDERIHRDQIRVRSIGRTDMLPESVQNAIASAEAATAHYDRRHLNVGIAYGGREEVLDAIRQHLRAEAERGRSLSEVADELDAATVEQYLYASGMPDPDLVIRTSGEVRTSGFLLWQSAYSEYYFCDANWPEFRKIDFLRALRSYHRRKRRYGK